MVIGKSGEGTGGVLRLRGSVYELFEGAWKSSEKKTGLEVDRMALSWCQDERMMVGEEQGGGRCGTRAGRRPGRDSSGRRLGKGVLGSGSVWGDGHRGCLVRGLQAGMDLRCPNLAEGGVPSWELWAAQAAAGLSPDHLLVCTQSEPVLCAGSAPALSPAPGAAPLPCPKPL